jgi:ferredoxin
MTYKNIFFSLQQEINLGTMARYKIVYDIEGCIGVFSCIATNPKHWKMGDGDLIGKAVLEGGTEDKKTGFIELEIGEEDLKVNMEAAGVCPPNVIHIFNLETGEKLI